MTTKDKALKLAREVIQMLGAPSPLHFSKDEIIKWQECNASIDEALAQQEGQSNYCLQCEALSREVAALKAQQSNEQSKCNHTKTITRADIDGNQIETTCGECGERVAQQSDEQVEPYAIEAGYDNGDGTYSVRIERLPRGLNGRHKDWSKLEKLLYTHPPVPTAQPKEPEQEHVADREVLRLADAIELRVENKAERMVIADKLRKLAYTTPPQRKPLPKGSCASEWGGRETGPFLYTNEQVLGILAAHGIKGAV